jgi:hypothetical protein
MVPIPDQVCKHNKSHLNRKRDEKTGRPGEYMPTCKLCQDNEDSKEPNETHHENMKMPEVDAALLSEVSPPMSSLSTTEGGQSRSAQGHIEFIEPGVRDIDAGHPGQMLYRRTGGGEEDSKSPRHGDNTNLFDGLTPRMSGSSTAADPEAEELERQIDRVQRMTRDPSNPAHT